MLLWAYIYKQNFIFIGTRSSYREAVSTLALRARKWIGLIFKRASEDTTLYIVLGEEERRMPNRDYFFLLRALRIIMHKLRYYGVVLHSLIGNQL